MMLKIVSARNASFKPRFFKEAIPGNANGSATMANVKDERNQVGAFHSSACIGNQAWNSMCVRLQTELHPKVRALFLCKR